ncbi:trypco2 family protein [Nonomuraea maheshkhaliensis]
MAKGAGIGLAETLRQVRAELAQAQEEGAGQRLRFKITEAELELAVVVAKEAVPGAKVKVEVVGIGGVEAGGEAKLARESTHRLTLTLAVTDTAMPNSPEAIITDDDSDDWGEEEG